MRRMLHENIIIILLKRCMLHKNIIIILLKGQHLSSIGKQNLITINSNQGLNKCYEENELLLRQMLSNHVSERAKGLQF